MNNKYLKLLFIMLGIIIIIISAVIIVKNYVIDPNKQSSIEIHNSIEKMYDGEIVSYKKEKKKIKIILQRNARNYSIEADLYSGEVLGMKDVTNTSAILSVKEVKKKLQREYPNATIRMELSEDKNKINYDVHVKREGEQKYLVVDAETGEVISENKNKKVKQSFITERAAKKIAGEFHAGKVSSIEYKKSTSGGYYLVSIVNDKKTTIVQVHAMSGELISTTVKKEQME